MRMLITAGVLCACLTGSAQQLASTHSPAPEPMVAVIVGGGPRAESNQVAIESNVRYVNRLLPGGTARTILFADGNRDAATVAFEKSSAALPPEEELARLISLGRNSVTDTGLRYRRPLITRIDGASNRTNLEAAIKRDARARGAMLLYFTGHGSPGDNFVNNSYDMWGESETVQDLATDLSAVPQTKHIVLIMAQCFSGGFANLQFKDGNPQGEPTNQDFAGFFATIPEKVAAGCTPELDEKNYHDFTSYFFAALSGRDRLGNHVVKPDYNHDGVVGMDEAFCYALSHDVSIDVPVCTTDVFLRRYPLLTLKQVFTTPLGTILNWASPAQRDALTALSQDLHLTQPDAPATAYNRMQTGLVQQGSNPVASAHRRFAIAYRKARADAQDKWPELVTNKSISSADRKAAVAGLRAGLDQPAYADLLAAEAEMEKAEWQSYQQDLADTRLVRFVRLVRTVALGHAMVESGEPALRARYAQLVRSEARPLLPGDRSGDTTPDASAMKSLPRVSGLGSEGLIAQFSNHAAQQIPTIGCAP